MGNIPSWPTQAREGLRERAREQSPAISRAQQSGSSAASCLCHPGTRGRRTKSIQVRPSCLFPSLLLVPTGVAPENPGCFADSAGSDHPISNFTTPTTSPLRDLVPPPAERTNHPSSPEREGRETELCVGFRSLRCTLQRAGESQVTFSDLSNIFRSCCNTKLFGQREKPHKRTASSVYWGMAHAKGERLKQTSTVVPMITRKR